MKKFLINFFLVAFYTATSFAASDVTISRAIPTKTQQETASEPAKKSTKTNSNRTAVSRTVSRSNSANTTGTRDGRTVSARKTGARATVNDAVNVVGRSTRTENASINSKPALRRAGIVLRASTAEVGGRATIGNTGLQTGSNIDEQVRNVHSRASLLGASKQKTVTAESLSEAKDLMEKTSDLNGTCQQQYNECMDQFCAVVDTNQKRCSCSANLSKYAKVQKAVEDANTELNDVAQQIRYVGLSADEIRAIMSATEAELEMTKTKDNTKTRSMLDDIADMIKDPTASTSLTASTTDSLLDMNFDFSGDNSDMFSLDMLNSSSNDISAKRGTALYNEAKKRCKTVLNRCKDAGGTENQISGNYDLAIAKDCIAYEQGLDKLNTTLLNNVRSANLMLQKARLAVLQNNNEYDVRGCIGALETCMLDDMVCGENYFKCLDPTKNFIDENGNVVLGRNITNITNFMTDYSNTKITSDFIKASDGDLTCAKHDGACIINYLMGKIGVGANVKDGGLCRAVLDKCRDYTYTRNGKKSVYEPYNEVVVNYIQRAMVNIKAAQSKIISEYAAACLADVADCYNQQNTQITSLTSSASIESIYNVMTGACYNVALTCGYAVFAYDVTVGQALENMEDPDNANYIPNATLRDKQQKTYLVQKISEMFYQSLLCPENSEYTDVTRENANANDQVAYVNERCKCKSGYTVSGAACVSQCGVGKYLDPVNGVCASSCPVVTNEDNTVTQYYKYDAARLCVENCSEYGLITDITNGKCVSTCPAGTPYHNETNTECYAACPSDKPNLLASTNTCYASCPLSTRVAFGNKCISGCPYRNGVQYYKYGTDTNGNTLCVSTCPDGTYTVSTSNSHRCVSMSAGCPEEAPYLKDNTTCVADCSLTPSSTPYGYDGVCYANCSSVPNVSNLYTDNVDHVCVADCALTSSTPYPYNGVCYSNCQGGTFMNYAANPNTCVQSCPNNTIEYRIMSNGATTKRFCEERDTNCPAKRGAAGCSLNNGVCECIPGTSTDDSGQIVAPIDLCTQAYCNDGHMSEPCCSMYRTS